MQKNNNNNPKHVPTSGAAISWACFVISFIRCKLLAIKPRQSFISHFFFCSFSSHFFLYLNFPIPTAATEWRGLTKNDRAWIRIAWWRNVLERNSACRSIIMDFNKWTYSSIAFSPPPPLPLSLCLSLAVSSSPTFSFSLRHRPPLAHR